MKNKINQNMVTSANKKYYNDVADDYLKNESYAYTKKITNDVEKLIDLAIANTHAQDVFLDIGCGSGFISKIVSKKKIFNMGIGVDISEKQIELYKKNLINSNFTGKVCDVNNLSFIKDESVDLICGYSVLHHFFDYYQVLDECFRVLKKGGVVYFDFEPNHHFKKNLKFLIKLKRVLFDKSPANQEGLEEMAEYHNNYENGLNFSEIRKRFDSHIELISFNYRYPDTFIGNILENLEFMGNFMSPLFNFILKKKK